jgi:heme exporter protein C
LPFVTGVDFGYDDRTLLSQAGPIMLDIRRRFWPLIGLCALVAALVLALMPAEKTLGQIIKLVYLHGALSRAGMIGFWAAAIAGATYLIRPNPRSLRWSQALLWSGCGFWLAHFIVSMPATRLTWGPWIAWGEPRVTMTLQVAAAGLIVIAVTWLVDSGRFTAVANLLLGLTVFFLVERTGVLRHPLDPIGTSPSSTLQLIYLLLVVPIVASMFLVAWRLTVAAVLRRGASDLEVSTESMNAKGRDKP